MLSDEKTELKFRLITENNKYIFRSLLENFDWESIFCLDVDIYTENFLLKLNEMYTNAFPIKTKIVSNKKILNPWVTPEISHLIQMKSNYFFLYKHRLVSLQDNNRFKNKLNKLIKKAKCTYYHNLFACNKNNMKKTWNTINTLLLKNIKPNSIKKLFSTTPNLVWIVK